MWLLYKVLLCSRDELWTDLYDLKMNNKNNRINFNANIFVLIMKAKE